LSTKKKKKKKTIALDEELGEDSIDSSGDSWLTSERDYTYEEVKQKTRNSFQLPSINCLM
jgi:hypothetical protein